MTQNKEEEERRKNKMKEKERAEELGSCLDVSNETSNLGRLELDCQLDEQKVEGQQSKIQDDDTKDTEYDGQDRRQAC